MVVERIKTVNDTQSLMNIANIIVMVVDWMSRMIVMPFPKMD